MLSNSPGVTGELHVGIFEAFEQMLNLADSLARNESGLVNIKSVDWWRFLDAFRAYRDLIFGSSSPISS